MRRLIALSLLAPLAACASSAPSASSDPAPRVRPAQAAQPARASKAAAGELKGLFVPTNPTEVALWPRAHRGELIVLSVAAQGQTVEAGALLAELDARGIEREMADAEFDLRAAQVAHEALVEKHALAAEGERAHQARTRAELERARAALEGWKQHELAFAERNDALSKDRDTNWIADQEDELEQLELMYKADELTDATEDLVLMRTRRDLELSRQRTQLNDDQRAFQAQRLRTKSTAEREEAFSKQQLELDHLTRRQALEAKAREVAQSKSARELERKRERLAELQRDRELFTLRAPVAGVFLHGAPADYRPGAVPTPLRRGSKLSPRSVVGHVAAAAPGAVALELDTATAAAVASGAKATVQATGRSGARAIEGTLRVDPYPVPSKGGAVYRARVELERPAEDLRTGMSATVQLEGSK